MVPTMRESFVKERSTEWEHIYGVMEVLTLAVGYSIISMALVSISGLMGAAMRALGRTTSYMVVEPTSGQMVEDTKENI